MNKCDFCTQSSPSGECRWSMQCYREDYCKQAIKLMTRALKKELSDVKD